MKVDGIQGSVILVTVLDRNAKAVVTLRSAPFKAKNYHPHIIRETLLSCCFSYGPYILYLFLILRDPSHSINLLS